jgi:hypothetical protein
MMGVVPVTYYDAAFAASLILTHPIVKLVVRAVSTIGAISAILLLLRESVVARRFAALAVVVLTMFLMVGCSTTDEINGKVVATTRVAPISGVYCAETLHRYQDSLINRVKFPDDPVSTEEFRRAALDYENCSTKHNADRVLVNPFNKIRDIGVLHE